MKLKCEDGVAKSCYDYAVVLRDSRDAADLRESVIFMRRACSMAFQPACTVPRPQQTPQTKCISDIDIANARVGSDSKHPGKVINVPENSVWSLSGFQPEDIIRKVNGNIVETLEQVNQALGGRAKTATVEREKQLVDLNIKCASGAVGP